MTAKRKTNSEGKQLYGQLESGIKIMQRGLQSLYASPVEGLGASEIRMDLIHGLVKAVHSLKGVLFGLLIDEKTPKEILEDLKENGML